MVSLLDVNCLIALLDQDHVHHGAMFDWFVAHEQEGWATCPITENGFVRVLSSPKYPSGQRHPAELMSTLQMLKANSAQHHFWPDDISLSDSSLFLPHFITGALLVTDAYLLGLAARHNAKLVSFDRSLPWQAIRGGSARLIETPLLQ